VDNNTLAEKTSASLPERVNMVGDLAYSPDGAYLASADDDRRVTVFTSTDYKVGHVLLAYLKLCVHCYVTVYMHSSRN